MATVKTIGISRSDLGGLIVPSIAKITDVIPLSSYNWIEASTPTIAIPGCPSRWAPPQGPRRLNKDSGLIYIAQNAARHPSCPLEPLFRALYQTNPDYNIDRIDVISDRNNIRKLLSFVNPLTSKDGLKPFTIQVEVNKDTAIFCRTETDTTEYIGVNDFRGYGHEFEKTYTTCMIPGSTGHYRIISYQFGGINFLVRHETDGYLGSLVGASQPNSRGDDSASGTDTGLSSLLESLTLGPDGITRIPGSKLTLNEGGQVVPLANTLEIKTRTSTRPFKFEELASQLWVSQTPQLVRAVHNRGVFKNPKVEDMTTEIQSWENAHQEDLKQLAALIQRIRGAVKECGGYAFVKYDGIRDRLLVSEDIEAKKMLPEDLYSRWEDESGIKNKTTEKVASKGK